MKFGLLLPNRGRPYGDVNLLLELALLAEESGWDGWFIWDHIEGGGDSPCIDPWVCLAAVASQTRAMRLGTIITPLARRRPWKVAREITSCNTFNSITSIQKLSALRSKIVLQTQNEQPWGRMKILRGPDML